MEIILTIVGLIAGVLGVGYVGVRQYGKNKSAEKVIKDQKESIDEAANTHRKINDNLADDAERQRVRDKYRRSSPDE